MKMIMKIPTEALQESLQLTVVVTPSWEESRGFLLGLERENISSKWNSIFVYPVCVGQNGMGWGSGLHIPCEDGPVKKEGDKKAPAGLFHIGPLFGSNESKDFHMPYVVLDARHEYVDDPSSLYYNRLVTVCFDEEREWNSSEKMLREDGLYELGFIVQHNEHPVAPYRGSCIFFHKWRNPLEASAGCTVMETSHLQSVCSWLNETKKPLLLQLPLIEYQAVCSEMNLPDLTLTW